MCLPAGARVGSNRLACTSRTNGRFGCSPRHTCVLGRRDLVERAAEVHGAGAGDLRGGPRDRPVERPVELEDAGPVAVAREPAPVAAAAAGRRPSAAAAAGVTSSSAGRRPAARRRTRPVGPSRSGRRASAGGRRARRRVAASRRAATGQPTACALTASTIPNAALTGVRSDSIECAQQPASSARARSPSKRERASPTAERIALRPKRAITSG